MNTKAKQRAQSRQTAPVESDPEDAPVQSAPLAPLAAPEGLQVFDVERRARASGSIASWGKRRRLAASRCRAPG